MAHGKAEYREYRPPDQLASYVECYWTMSATDPVPSYQVLPDGCADLLFTRKDGRSELTVVGNMTEAQQHAVSSSEAMFGVRFLPAMASLFLKAPWASLVNKTMDAQAVLGCRAADLARALEDATRVDAMISITTGWLGRPRTEGAAHRLAKELAQSNGQMRLDALSSGAGISPRQMRRLFVAETGLSPKQLGRILRFRGSLAQLGTAEGARVAVDCGYYDQAHFIHEFREFSGETPQNFLAQRRP